jgi:hypothetical protein
LNLISDFFGKVAVFQRAFHASIIHLVKLITGAEINGVKSLPLLPSSEEILGLGTFIVRRLGKELNLISDFFGKVAVFE